MATETKTVLITARTYPTPAKKGVEVSCTAGITEQGEWIRLFPVPYRFLDVEKRFKKYQWIKARVRKATDDVRPESFKLDADSIEIVSPKPLSTAREWAARKAVVLPLRAHCLCCLKRERDAKGAPTLGVFKPKIINRLVIEADDATWTTKQRETLAQGSLFQDAPKAELEKIPYSFQYDFHCDETGCSGHTLSCTDWEMGESWRQWHREYGSEWEAKFRQRYETEMIEKNDTHFYVGTVHKFPATWIIVGLFYPRLPAPAKPLPLFDRK
jgi:hypothetical protein